MKRSKPGIEDDRRRCEGCGGWFEPEDLIDCDHCELCEKCAEKIEENMAENPEYCRYGGRDDF